ncbi:hypothetical protein OOT46_24765 [Aquabacterium sp. A7-Y]|uniref:hypothetical protein n=1 Tax=Aquabacterium sp. A7-Y TaxID=1349605 RepID=UPI00223D4CF2|nr:hypothetical protein [Aquabacterium sp. A7-Y]MCW7541034.1 hypothetical protein [Aquabacterium sp. A7-Y]
MCATFAAAALAAFAALPASAAGLPAVATEDPGRVAAGGCQVEGWYQHASGANALLSNPACSETAAPRLGGNLTALQRSKEGNWGLGAAAKISDAAWRYGPARWGLKVSTYTQRLAEMSRFELDNATVLGLATFTLPSDMSLRLNFGPRYHTPTGQTSTLLNAAVLWALDDRLSLAGEMQSSDRASTVQSLGTNWWLVPGRLGMKLSAGRTIGAPDSTTYSFQLNWHLLDRSPARR